MLMVRKSDNKYLVVINIPSGNAKRYFDDKTSEIGLKSCKTKKMAELVNQKVEAYWDNLNVQKRDNTFPYGNQLFNEHEIDSLEEWNREKEYLKIADQELDYLWNINTDGSITLIDRAYSSGIIDETVKSRRKMNELEITFEDFPKMINWTIKKALTNYIHNLGKKENKKQDNKKKIEEQMYNATLTRIKDNNIQITTRCNVKTSGLISQIEIDNEKNHHFVREYVTLDRNHQEYPVCKEDEFCGIGYYYQ